MTLYRKKPVVVEAFQMTFEHRNDNADWPVWLHRAWNIGDEGEGGLCPATMVGILTETNTELAIRTLEGPMLVNHGDWIIQGVKGEIYLCKPDIFEATYEAV